MGALVTNNSSMKTNLMQAAMLCLCVVSLSSCGVRKLEDDPTSEPVPQASDSGDNGSQNAVIDQPPADGVTSQPATPNPPSQPVAPISIQQKYSYVDPLRQIPDKLLLTALSYYDEHFNQIQNKNFLSVVDFSARSNKARFFIMDMKSGSVWSIHVAHGSGSDKEGNGYATSFSNVPGSNASSLGFYSTAETYQGNYGLSLRLDGLSSTNSKVRSRAVVLHGSDYVQEANVIAGRSWGCLAVNMTLKDKVISLLKNGSIIYAGLSANSF